MNEEALRQLARVVNAAPENRFDMRRFYSHGSLFACGTAYCAAGWAALDPWFAEHAGGAGSGLGSGPRDAALDRFHDFCRFSHLERVFDLDEQQTEALFGGNLPPTSRPPSKQAVLRKIKQLLAGQVISAYVGWATADPQ